MRSNTILKGAEGKGSIGEYLGVSKPTVYKYIKMGMPSTLIFGTLYSHALNIEEWFKMITRRQIKDLPDEDVK